LEEILQKSRQSDIAMVSFCNGRIFKIVPDIQMAMYFETKNEYCDHVKSNILGRNTRECLCKDEWKLI
jgi:hypothetical protein